MKAETEDEAVRLIDPDPREYLEPKSVTRTEYKKYKQDTGWAAGIRNQLIGGTASVESSRLPPEKRGGSSEC